jgi:hypothetical protein
MNRQGLDKYTDLVKPEMTARVQNSFTYHAPKEDQLPRYEYLRDRAKLLAMDALTMVPPGREQSTALTKLEEFVMWCNKGIACGE